MVISRVGAFLVLFVAFFSARGLSQELGDDGFSSFNKSFFPLFGNDQVIADGGGRSVQISLDRSSGSGFQSKDVYLHASFSAAIRLPANYTAGVVVTFYTSNNDKYEGYHDELDFEFLGNIKSKDWVVQTNVYGNGSTSRGREERYNLWFDPTEDFHTYRIVWTSRWIVFYVDDIPIRETKRVDAMAGDFPSKPMSLLATIWDGSEWATNGGRNKIDYSYSPFVAQYSDFKLAGCSVDPTQQQPNCGSSAASPWLNGLNNVQRLDMQRFRMKHMLYSYCNDHARYPSPLPECVPWHI